MPVQETDPNALKEFHSGGGPQPETDLDAIKELRAAQDAAKRNATTGSGLDRLERQARIAGGSALSGLSELSGQFMDASPIGMLQTAVNQATRLGKDVAHRIQGTPSGGLSSLITGAPKDGSDGGDVIPTGRQWGEALGNVARRAVGSPDVEDMTPHERIAAEATKYGTEALLTAGEGSVPALIRAGLSGTLSGASGEVAKQAGLGPLGQNIAAFAGGVAPEAIEGLARGVGKLASYTGLASGKQQAAEILQHHSPDAATAAYNIAQAQQQPSVPGVQPTTAELAGDTGLAALQRSKLTDPIQRRLVANAQAVHQNVNALGGAGDPAAVQRLAQAQDVAGATGIKQAVNRVNPNVVDEATSGSNYRKIFDPAYDVARDASSAAFEHPAMQQTVPIPGDVAGKVYHNAYDTAHKFFANQGGDAPVEVQNRLYGILNELSGDTVNTQSVTNVDRGLAEFAAGSNRKTAAFTNQIRRDIMGELTPHLPLDYLQQREIARATRLSQGQTFEQGTVGRAMGDRGFGEPRTSDEMLPRKLVPTGPAGAQTAREMIAATGSDAAEQMVREQMRRIISKGDVIPETTIANYRQITNKFPRLKTDLAELISKNQAYKVFKASPFGKMGDPSVLPQDAISKLLTSTPGDPAVDNVIQSIKSSGNQDAMDGFRRILADHINGAATSGPPVTDAAGRAIPNTDKTLTAVDQVLAHSQGVLTPEQQQVLHLVRQQTARTNFVAKQGVTQADPDMRNIALPTYGYVHNIFKFLWDHFGVQKNQDKMVEKALLDPSFASKLLLRPTYPRVRALMRSMRQYAQGSVMAATNTNRSQAPQQVAPPPPLADPSKPWYMQNPQ